MHHMEACVLQVDRRTHRSDRCYEDLDGVLRVVETLRGSVPLGQRMRRTDVHSLEPEVHHERSGVPEGERPVVEQDNFGLLHIADVVEHTGQPLEFDGSWCCLRHESPGAGCQLCASCVLLWLLHPSSRSSSAPSSVLVHLLTFHPDSDPPPGANSLHSPLAPTASASIR